MTDRTYLYGYGEWQTCLTLGGLNARLAWSNLATEFERRLLALFDYCIDRGHDVGIGGGWRSSEQQRQVFIDRHYVVPCGTTGTIAYDGKCYKLKPGEAPSAPPGSSYHETTEPNGGAIAADLIGDIRYADDIAHLFGLRSLANLLPPNDELWHHQPIEVATARRNYNGVAITAWQFPGSTLPTPTPTPSGRIIDMYGISYQLDRWPGPHLDRVGIDSIEHVQDGDAWQIDQFAGVPVKVLTREQYIAVIKDRGRRHVSIAPDGTNTQDPFGADYDSGNYADLELSGLWRAQQRS